MRDSTTKKQPLRVVSHETNDRHNPPALLDLPGPSQILQPAVIHTYLQAATAPNTRKAYQSDIQHFMAWGGLLPTTPDILLRYLHNFADHLKPQTLKRRLVALKQWHLCQGFTDPTKHPLITQTLTGIHHVHGQPVTKTPALSLEQLTLLVNYLQSRNQLSDLRDNALLQVGFFGAFRRSELTEMTWEQVEFVKEGVEILIPRSKTDQMGEGQVCAIPLGQTTLCPVTALKRWGESSGISKGPVFRAIHKNGQIRSKALSASHVNVILKRHANTCQLPQANVYSGHSMRRGFATAAARSGATLGAIMRQGRWRHEGTVHGYIEAGKRFEANAAGLLLQKNQKNKALP